MKTWIIPRIPKSANKMLRAHWSQRRRDQDSWREHVRRSCGRRKRAFAGKVRLLIVVYRRTRQDPDNAYASVKNLLDALVKEGWLEDDSSEFLSLRVLEREEPRKVDERTEVTWMPVRERESSSGNGGNGVRQGED